MIKEWSQICIIGRIYDPKHPTCRSCKVGCGHKVVDSPPVAEVAKPRGGKPNKTETAYGHHLEMEFPGCQPIFEGLKLKLATGQVYSPDWVVRLSTGILCVEVKNAAYQHASYGRSRMAFNYAKLEWPFMFRWVEKTKEGWKDLP